MNPFNELDAEGARIREVVREQRRRALGLDLSLPTTVAAEFVASVIILNPPSIDVVLDEDDGEG